MKSAQSLHSFNFVLFCLSSILHFQVMASEPPENGSNVIISLQDLEVVRGCCQQQLHGLDQSLSDTIQLVSSKTVTVDNPNKTLDDLVATRMLVSNLLQEVRNITIAQPHNLKQYLDSIEKISLHIEAMLSDLNTSKPFEYVPNRSAYLDEEAISLQQLHTMADYNSQIVDDIVDQQSKLGLTSYNRYFRKLDAFFGKHHNKFTVALKTGIVGIAALALFYRYYPLTKTFGDAPQYTNSGLLVNGIDDPLHNPHGLGQLGRLGIIEDSLRSMVGSSFHPFAWPTLSSTAAFLYAKGSAWGGQYFERARNWLKGGIYKQYTIESYEAHRMSSDITFDDLIGLEHVKKQLREYLDFIKNPEPQARLDAKPSKGALLCGPPGTGKTHIVEAMQGEIKKMFADTDKEIKIYRFEACEVLMHGMKAIMDYMENKAPCIIFIDELDMLRLQRTGNAELLANFLEAMSGMVEGKLSMDLEKQVIVIAATNKIENLDKALLRPGRFGLRIPFELPTVQERLMWLQKRLSGLYVDMSQFDLEKTAHITHGCIYEHLNMAVKAMIRQSKDYGIPMNQSLLDRMVDSEIRRVVFGYDKQLPQEELQVIAAHHVGRALAGILLQSRYLLDKITLHPVAIDKEERSVWDWSHETKDKKEKETTMGAVFTYPLGDSLNVSTARDQEIRIKELLAGHVAEDILIGSASYSYTPFNSRNQAFTLALKQVSKGVDIKSYSEDMGNKLRDKAHELIDSYEAELTALFSAHKHRMTLMLLTLILSKELMVEDIAALLKLDDNEAHLILQDAKRLELLDLLLAEIPMSSSDIIQWLTIPQEEFDKICAEIEENVAQSNNGSSQGIVPQEQEIDISESLE